MSMVSIIAVGAGAMLGAWLRWWLGMLLNPVFPTLPLGTLASNLIGGYIIGLAVGAVSLELGLPPQARLFLMTGFCGGLTTFSTFSAETFTLFSEGQIAWGIGEVLIHVSGSLLATTMGFFSVKILHHLMEGLP
ncbi:MAG TPA: fluoride efflux transporter CrcB [Gammaproteobacteria bacterium]|nr:fluoride efflux transporter CrcB [Gammaproteobacteria bacterium]